MSRSPIQRMIDQACGLPDGWENDPKYAPKPQVTLECRKCGRTKQAEKSVHDPEGTVRIVCDCPLCDSSDKRAVAWFDKDGKELQP